MTHKVEIRANNLYFTGNINESSSHDFVVNLHQLESDLYTSTNKSINIYLHSSGGSVYSGLSMYDSITNSNLDITIIAQGYVASSATILLCAANKAISKKNTTFLIHDISHNIDSNHINNKACVEYDDKLKELFLSIYSNRTTITSDMMDKDTYLTAEQALELKLVTEII